VTHTFEPGPIIASLCGLCSLPASAPCHQPAEQVIHECRPSPLTGRCVLCGVHTICGSTSRCVHDGQAYGGPHGANSDREGPEQAPPADSSARLADTLGPEDAFLREPIGRSARLNGMDAS
jgi:hypothetical protein